MSPELKYTALACAFLVCPFLVILAYSKKALRRFLMAASIFATSLPGWFDINLISREGYRGTVRGFEITLPDLLILILFFTVCLRSQIRKKLFIPGFWPHLFFLVCAGLSLVFSLEDISVLYGAFAIFQYVKGLLLYWTFYHLIEGEQDYLLLVKTLATVAVFNGAVALAHRYLFHVHRVAGYLGHPNLLGAYMNLVGLVLIPAACRSLLPTVSQRRLVLAGAICAVSVVVLSISRGALLALAGGITLAFATARLKTPSPRTLLSMVLTAILALAFLIKAGDTILVRFQDPNTLPQSRKPMNDFSIAMAERNIFGGGYNNFSKASKIALEQYGTLLPPAHSIYFLTLGEMGYVGLVALLAVWLRFLSEAVRLVLQRKKLLAGNVLKGILIALIALLIQSAADDHPRRTAIWCLVSVYFAFIARGGSVMRLADRHRNVPQTVALPQPRSQAC